VRRLPRRSPRGRRRAAPSLIVRGSVMKYVYILESLDSKHFYVGITNDLRTRLA
jgi:hypothetical protein